MYVQTTQVMCINQNPWQVNMYYIQLTLMPVFFIMVLTKNSYKLMKQAWRWSVSETMEAYRSHRRVYNKD